MIENHLMVLSQEHNMIWFNIYKGHFGEELTRKMRVEAGRLVG